MPIHLPTAWGFVCALQAKQSPRAWHLAAIAIALFVWKNGKNFV
jgi:hypothetical protein